MEDYKMNEKPPPSTLLESVQTNMPARAARQSRSVPALFSLRLRLLSVFFVLGLVPLALFIYIIHLLNLNTWLNLLLLVVFITTLAAILARTTNRMVILRINRMRQVIHEVAAGSWWEKAPEGKDEIGLLGRAFNLMTSELRTTLHDLEQRNAERASALDQVSKEMSYRATQLKTVTEVARAIASVQDPDLLLNQVTQLISERFKFYHVGIFLLDRKGEYAILQAANSEGGQRMLERGHRLKTGQEGIVGYVAQQGEPRVAHDVGEDATYFDNPDLPYTRSELAIPLKAAEKVTGVLDVQSMEQSAFTDDDINLLSTLADQVAVAIENVRLYTETRKALAELENTHQQYLQERWTRLAEERRDRGYQYRYGKVTSLRESDVKEGSNEQESETKPLNLGEPANISENRLDIDEIIAPINVRGQLIGSLQLGKEHPTRRWSEEDLHLIRVVADQVGQALENSRLLEETQRRAEREHLVSEITTKLRASNNPQVILKTAMSELREVLRIKHAHFITQQDSQSRWKQGDVSGTNRGIDGDGS
jgi:GAF domain-containing protein/HAMP domain-containing protein